mgnify:CR=1 FL=1
MAEKAMIVDTSVCMGCRGCQVACKQWNDLPAENTNNAGSYENPPDLSYNTWARVIFNEFEQDGEMAWLFRFHHCLHCTDAACVRACPTGALFKHEMGFVSVDVEKCNGCGYCTYFCPFNVPRLEIRNLLTGEAKVSKCTFCTDRVSNGLPPACAKTCPAGAIKYGERDEMLAVGRKRVEELKAKGYPDAYLYGETEMGGLHQMYVLAHTPSAYGLPEKPQYPALTNIWQDIIQPLGGLAVGATALGLIINFLVARRAMIKKIQERKEA